MKFLFKSFILLIVFTISLILFSPKEQMFNLIEKQLVKKDIIISDEIKKSKPFSFEVSGANIYFQQILTANIKDIEVESYLFYSKAKAKNISISKSLEQFLPKKIDVISLEYSIIDFKNVKLVASGDFGEFTGDFDIISRVFKGELKPSGIMRSKYRNLLTQFKLVKGKYTYEQRF